MTTHTQDCECDCCSGLCACDDNFGCTCEEFRGQNDTAGAAMGCISYICGYCPVGCFCDWDGACRFPLDLSDPDLAESPEEAEELEAEGGEIQVGNSIGIFLA